MGARCAIKMHSKTGDVDKLRVDLRNGPKHVFNNHQHCSPTFCKVAASTSESNEVALIDSISDTPSEIDTLLAQYLEDEVQIHNEEDESRGNNPSCNHRDISDDLFFRIKRAGDRLVSMAPQLISNSNSNMAESFMNIRCKFDGGKFYNRIQRGSFQHRTYGAALRFQLGPDWTSKVWFQTTGTEPGDVRKEFDACREKEHENMMKRKSTSQYKEQRKKTR